MGSAEGEFELEVSDEALAVVDRWLRIKHTDEIPATELPEQRPQRYRPLSMLLTLRMHPNVYTLNSV